MTKFECGLIGISYMKNSATQAPFVCVAESYARG